MATWPSASMCVISYPCGSIITASQALWRILAVEHPVVPGSGLARGGLHVEHMAVRDDAAGTDQAGRSEGVLPRDEVEVPALVVRHHLPAFENRAPSPGTDGDLADIVILSSRREGRSTSRGVASSGRPAIAREADRNPDTCMGAALTWRSPSASHGAPPADDGRPPGVWRDPASGQSWSSRKWPPAPRPSASGTWPRRSPPAGPRRSSSAGLAGREGGIVGELGAAHGREKSSRTGR